MLPKIFQSSYANISLAFSVTRYNLEDHFQDLGPHCTDVHPFMGQSPFEVSHATFEANRLVVREDQE